MRNDPFPYFDFLSQTQLGTMFGVSSLTIGHWLAKLGLRTGRVPAPEAIQSGLAKAVGDGEMTFYSWHKQRVVELLEGIACKPPSPDWKPTMRGPFTLRDIDSQDDGYQVVGRDDKVHVLVKGKDNAEVVLYLLNLGQQHGKFG